MEAGWDAKLGQDFQGAAATLAVRASARVAMPDGHPPPLPQVCLIASELRVEHRKVSGLSTKNFRV